jgi:hypothetical protein
MDGSGKQTHEAFNSKYHRMGDGLLRLLSLTFEHHLRNHPIR